MSTTQRKRSPMPLPAIRYAHYSCAPRVGSGGEAIHRQGYTAVISVVALVRLIRPVNRTVLI